MNHEFQVIRYHNAANWMTKEFVTLACTPHEEKCVQAGWDHIKDGEFECAVLIRQLIRMNGLPVESATFFIVENHHETGIYHEAAIHYRNNDEQAEDYAILVEDSIPNHWDGISLRELKESRHVLYIPQEPAKVVKHQGKVVKIKSQTA